MLMVHVRRVRVFVLGLLVAMNVRVLTDHRFVVDMVVMTVVVAMSVLVLDGCVNVTVRVALREV